MVPLRCVLLLHVVALAALVHAHADTRLPASRMAHFDVADEHYGLSFGSCNVTQLVDACDELLSRIPARLRRPILSTEGMP